MSLLPDDFTRYFFVFAAFLLIDALKVVVEIWNRPVRRDFRDDDLRNVTALIPTHNGVDVISETVADLIRAGLVPQRILVIDDASTDGTPQLLAKLGVRHYSIPRMGKVSALNFGIQRVDTPYVLLLDDDTRIGTARIPTSLLEEYEAAAFNVVPDRRDRHGPRGSGLIAGFQRYEYCKSMEIGRRFQDATASIACVSGAIGLFRRDRLQRLHHEHSGAFEGEDLQRTIIELLNDARVVFVDQRVWTVVPDTLPGLVRQRLASWYPAQYHLFLRYFRLLFKKRVSWRLRYEMAYSIFVVLGDPFRVLSLAMIVWLGRWDELLLLYLLYLMLEALPFGVIQKKLDTGYPWVVFLLYPVFGLLNSVLRLFSFVVWVHKRFVTGEMRRKTEKDRRWSLPPER